MTWQPEISINWNREEDGTITVTANFPMSDEQRKFYEQFGAEMLGGPIGPNGSALIVERIDGKTITLREQQ